MPTYEYVCESCGHGWELFQSIKDNPVKKCPSCSKLRAKRQISAGSGFILKGGGWYSDLYASAKKGGSSEASTEGSSSESSGSAESSAPSKAATTSSDGDTKAKPAKAEKKPDAKGGKGNKGGKPAAS